MQGGLGPAHVWSLVGGSVYESPEGPGWLTVLVFLWSSYSLRSCNPSSYSSRRVPKLYSLFDCGYTPLSESVGGWGLSEDCHARLLSGTCCHLPSSGSGVGSCLKTRCCGYYSLKRTLADQHSLLSDSLSATCEGSQEHGPHHGCHQNRLRLPK